MIKSISRRFHWFLLTAAAFTFFFYACQTSEGQSGSSKISFNKIYDQLAKYDSVLITLKDADGRTLDVVFHGKVGKPGDVENLPAPHWDGGQVTVSIIGYEKNAVVYNVDTQFDGHSNQKGQVNVFVDPGTSLSSLLRDYLLLGGDTLPFPAITITPATLIDKSLKWRSSRPEVVAVGATSLKALIPGTSEVTVYLASDTTRTLVFTITVVDPTRIPESLALSADTLYLASGGALGRLNAVLSPSTAYTTVSWKTADSTIASVSADGMVKGLKAGTTLLRAVSTLKASAKDSAVVVVSDPVPVAQVRFLKDSTEIFVHGAAESLLVEVTPPRANQEVVFSVSDLGKVDLKGARISGTAEGVAYLIVASKENPLKADTLKVRVSPSQTVDAVVLNTHELLLYTGAAPQTLTATVVPATSASKIQWRSSKPGIAGVDQSGKVQAVASGKAIVSAISIMDSLKWDSATVTVKTDAPVVSVGQDTVISVGQTVKFLPVVAKQEYGDVVKFKWDLDGNQVWDDSSDAVKEVSAKFDQEKITTVRFYVRDTEGNETIALKKVQATVGPVVIITAPAANSYTNKDSVKVAWSVNGQEQTTLTSQKLAVGANTITRSAKDAAGKDFSYSITVYLDVAAPGKPQVHGPANATNARPTWTWASGGGGNGLYRTAMDAEAFSGESKDTSFTPPTALKEGGHTLNVQERDDAGNWSASGSLSINIDLAAPGKPVVKVGTSAITSVLKPTWTWKSGGGGSGLYQYKLEDSLFASGGTEIADSTFTPKDNLANGAHTLFVREKDAAGLWSPAGSASVTIDNIAPPAPKVSGPTPTGKMPKWTWVSGGAAGDGSGDFRYKLDGDPASGGTETRLLEYALTSAATGTTYTLYVQEKDAAGNWSTSGSLAIKYDLSKPTVTFTSPGAAGTTFLTRNGTVDVSGGATSPQGKDKISKIEYTLDGVAGTLATNLNGETWSIKGVPLTNNKTIALKVIATDALGNAGDATLNLQMDATAPANPVFTSSLPAFVNGADTRTTLQWTWTRGGAETDGFIVKLNGTEVARQTALSYSTGNLTDKAYTLEIAEYDVAGNTGSFVAAAVVTVDRTGPGAPTVTAPSPGRQTNPKWTWGSAGGGNGVYQYRLANGSAPTSAGTTLAKDVTEYQASGLADGSWQLQAREQDPAGNWGAWSGSATAIVKATKPSKPNVTATNGNLAVNAIWKWTSGNSGQGNGTFKYHFDKQGTIAENTDKQYQPAQNDGTLTLCVAEKDMIDYGDDQCVALTIDRKAPVIANVSVNDGFVTNASSITMNFTWDGNSDHVDCSLKDGGSFNCAKTVTDGAGNPSTVSRTVWYYSNTLFATVDGGGNGSGSSWDNPIALKNIMKIKSGYSNKSVWIRAGNYHPIDYEFELGSGMKLYGGFSASDKYPNSLSQRDIKNNKTTLDDVVFIADEDASGNSQAAKGVHIEGLWFTGNGEVTMANNSSDIWVKNCTFNSTNLTAAVRVIGTDIHLEGLEIKNGKNFEYAGILIDNGSGVVSIVGGNFESNNAGLGAGGLFMYDGTVTVSGGARFYGNTNGSSLLQIKIWGGKLNIDGCQIDEGPQGIDASDPAYLNYGNNTRI